MSPYRALRSSELLKRSKRVFCTSWVSTARSPVFPEASRLTFWTSLTVFAIYLDPDEPTNLVESYTFTFTYEVDAEGNKVPLSSRRLKHLGWV